MNQQLPPRVQTLAACAALFALNAFLCRELFTIEYTHHLGSIEGSYMALSRYVARHWFDLTWFPLWYAGIPFQNSYPPLLHTVVTCGVLAGVSPGHAFHAASAVFYCLAPVTFFVFARRLLASLPAALGAGAIYSLWSPCLFLLPSLTGDVGTRWASRRLQNLVMYGDAPHIAALALIPVALLGVHALWERGNARRFALAALALAAIPLTNWLGAFALAVGALSYLLARAGERGWLIRTARLAAAALAAYALAAPWIPPTTIAAVRTNAELVEGYYPMGWRQIVYGVLAVAAAVLLQALLRRFRISLPLRFALLFLGLIAAITLSAGWWGILMVPQPLRYHLELDWALCLLGALLAGAGGRRLPSPVRLALMALLLGAGLGLGWGVRQQAAQLIRPIEMQATIEYQAARWLHANLPGRRVFAIGSTQFWLNAFADNPQLGGGFAQGVINPLVPLVLLGSPDWRVDGATAARWLRLAGVQAVVVSGPDGRDAYKQGWQNPQKFAGVLPELWRDGGDVIYGLPQRSNSLAHVILPEQVISRKPYNLLDLPPVEPLLRALDDLALPPAELEWKGAGEALVSATLAREQVLFVQVSYHPGWKATVNGRSRPVRSDAAGFLIIEPGCDGPCQVRLRYDGGAEMRAAKLACGAAVVVFSLCLLWPRRRRSHATRDSSP